MKELFKEIPYLKGERVTLRKLTAEDTEALRELVNNDEVYRYLPTSLYEKKYDSVGYVIEHLYDECIKDSLILGVFLGGEFCGLAEIYGYSKPDFKVSIGYRLLPAYWRRGIAKETLSLLIGFLADETDIEKISASTMSENKASAHILEKSGFKLVTHAVYEDWGYDTPKLTDKWILNIK